MWCIPTCVVADLRIDTSDYREELLGLTWSTSFSSLATFKSRTSAIALFIIARETETGQLATIIVAGIGFVCYYGIRIGLTITFLELEFAAITVLDLELGKCGISRSRSTA